MSGVAPAGTRKPSAGELPAVAEEPEHSEHPEPDRDGAAGGARGLRSRGDGTDGVGLRGQDSYGSRRLSRQALSGVTADEDGDQEAEGQLARGSSGGACARMGMGKHTCSRLCFRRALGFARHGRLLMSIHCRSQLCTLVLPKEIAPWRPLTLHPRPLPPPTPAPLVPVAPSQLPRRKRRCKQHRRRRRRHQPGPGRRLHGRVFRCRRRHCGGRTQDQAAQAADAHGLRAAAGAAAGAHAAAHAAAAARHAGHAWWVKALACSHA